MIVHWNKIKEEQPDVYKGMIVSFKINSVILLPTDLFQEFIQRGYIELEEQDKDKSMFKV